MGVKTLYEYFYKLAYGDKGADKATLVNDCLDIADAEIKANKDAKHTQNTDTDLDAAFKATLGGYSNVVKCADYDHPDDAITAIGADNKTLLVTEAEVCDTNFIVPINVTVKFERGGKWIINTGITVTFNGQIDAGLWKIFEYAGTGTLAGTLKIKEVYPQWWGALGDGSNDDTIAIQKALNIFPEIFFPSGNYKITSELTLSSNHHLFGVGKNSKILTTTNNINLVSATSVNNIIIEKLQFYGNNTSSAITNGNGVIFDTVNDITIRDCFFHNFGGADNNSSAINIYVSCNRVNIDNNYIDGGVGTSNASDICLYSNISDFIITGNKTYSTNSQGIYAVGTAGTIGIISGNISKNHARHGIVAYSSAIKRLVISNNECETNGWTGIYVTGGGSSNTQGRVIIEGNYTKSNGTADNSIDGNIVVTGTGEIIVNANISETAVRRGIYINLVSNLIISNNIIIDPTEDGIQCYQSKSNVIVNDNLITNAGGMGIYFVTGEQTANNIKIVANTVIEPMGFAAIHINASGGEGAEYLISNNQIRKSGANSVRGIDLRYISKIKISDNGVNGFNYGISLASNTNFNGGLVSNNIISNCITYGIYYEAQNVVISNNIMKDNGTDYFNDGGSNVSIYYQLDSNRWYNNGQSTTRGTAAPTAGTWNVGDICWKTDVAAGGSPGWICTTAGTPGTWKAMAVVGT